MASLSQSILIVSRGLGGFQTRAPWRGERENRTLTAAQRGATQRILGSRFPCGNLYYTTQLNLSSCISFVLNLSRDRRLPPKEAKTHVYYYRTSPFAFLTDIFISNR